MNLRLNLICVPAILASALLFSCQKTPSSYRPQPETPAGGKAGFNTSPVKLDSSAFGDFAVDMKPFHTEAHRKYLGEPLEFAPLPDQDIPTGKSAVVGSRVCVLYPGATLESTSDLAGLPAGRPIPFGTIIPISGGRIADPDDTEHSGTFHYQDNWNWFYRTTYEGKEGLVFGADLYGLEDTNEENRISARLYQTGGKYDAFHPIAGYRSLPKPVIDRLEKEKLAFQSVGTDEYDLSGYRNELMPDDMIALYRKHDSASYRRDWNRKMPVFVTTDLVAHAQHLMFDRTLQFLEEAMFMPRLGVLVDAFLSDLAARAPRAGGYRETHDKAVLYFQVAKALLELAPERVVAEEKWGGDSVTYREKDGTALLSAYPAAVREEIAKMDEAAGFDDSSVFAFKDGTRSLEDYSQYSPRGHYTKNGALAAYFRAMMWFGRIHFLIAQSGPEPLADKNGSSPDSTALSLAMAPIALLVTDIAKNDSKLYEAWCRLFDPITALIGLSDDLSFEELMPLWKDMKVAQRNFGAWVGDRDKLLGFMRKAHEKLRPPAISGSSVFLAPSEGTGKLLRDGAAESLDRRAPMGWRLFGQRFTYDSAVHDQVSPPRLLSRDMVRGLDIMKAFGSRTADSLLARSDYPAMEGLEQRLDIIEREFDSRDAKFWQRSYYSAALFQVRTQARFEPGAGFYFTESPAWGTKAMLSAHGTWSELRHDTILYAKQSGAERSGGGDFEPTFRTEAIPEPVHYLEPNLPFWQGSAVAVQKFLKTLDVYGLLDEETSTAFVRLQEICAKAARISLTESRDLPLSPADLAWIATIPAELVPLVFIHVGEGDVEDADQLRMAIVADVFTNAELGKVLETGLGIPYRIYVPLNDGQGGKRIAVGYGFSYYEFEKPIGERMTDETWKTLVYSPGADLEAFKPFWSRALALPPEPARTNR
jgi:hypothetical protein